MTDEPLDRPTPPTEPIELSEEEIATLVEALRLLQAALDREEADQLTVVKHLLAKLGASPSFSPGR